MNVRNPFPGSRRQSITRSDKRSHLSLRPASRVTATAAAAASSLRQKLDSAAKGRGSAGERRSSLSTPLASVHTLSLRHTSRSKDPIKHAADQSLVPFTELAVAFADPVVLDVRIVTGLDVGDQRLILLS